jgi:hypothetical protein
MSKLEYNRDITAALFATTSRMALRPTQTPDRLILGVSGWEHEAFELRPSIAEVKNA